jgi:hypothetical protein
MDHRRPDRRCWEDESSEAALALLVLVAGQDVEPAEGSDGRDGRWRLARRVAPDRVISTVDPEARHTRKSPSQRKDGYRAHVVAEPDTGLITDETLTMAAGADNADAAVAASFLTTTTGEQAATEDATEDAPEDATTGEPRSSGEWQPVLETMQLTRCGRCLRQGMVRFSLAGVLMFCHRAVQAGPSPDGWCGCWCLGDGGWLGLGCCGSCRCHGGCF